VITIEVVERGSFDEAFARVLGTAQRLWGTLREAEIVVRESGQATFTGVPNGVYCEGCRGHPIPGVRWPTRASGDSSHQWVERCDTCCRFPSDEAAAARVIEDCEDLRAVFAHGHARPAGSRLPGPYVDVEDRVRVRFVAQLWVDDEAVEVEPLGPATFEIPAVAAKGADGRLVAAGSLERDALKDHPAAPAWIRDWAGPFAVLLDDDGPRRFDQLEQGAG
jgi:hypothetical protein